VTGQLKGSEGTPSNLSMVVDVYEAARTARTLQGEVSQTRLPRVVELREEPALEPLKPFGESANPDAVEWQAEFYRVEANAQPAQNWLRLSFHTQVLQKCVRCLEPVSVAIREERQFVFVGSEERAGELDEDLEMADVLVGSKHFDLAALIEDEIILALPTICQHEHCDLPMELDDMPSAPAKRGAFDALKGLDWSKAPGKKH
jgi:uncharacterized protein